MCQDGSNNNNAFLCTEEVPALREGQNFFPITSMETHTKIMHHNYTIAARNPLYPNGVKLEFGR